MFYVILFLQLLLPVAVTFESKLIFWICITLNLSVRNAVTYIKVNESRYMSNMEYPYIFPPAKIYWKKYWWKINIDGINSEKFLRDSLTTNNAIYCDSLTLSKTDSNTYIEINIQTAQIII